MGETKDGGWIIDDSSDDLIYPDSYKGNKEEPRPKK